MKVDQTQSGWTQTQDRKTDRYIGTDSDFISGTIQGKVGVELENSKMSKWVGGTW